MNTCCAEVLLPCLLQSSLEIRTRHGLARDWDKRLGRVSGINALLIEIALFLCCADKFSGLYCSYEMAHPVTVEGFCLLNAQLVDVLKPRQCGCWGDELTKLKLSCRERMADVPSCFFSFLVDMTSVITCLAVSPFLYLQTKQRGIEWSFLFCERKDGRVKLLVQFPCSLLFSSCSFHFPSVHDRQEPSLVCLL